MEQHVADNVKVATKNFWEPEGPCQKCNKRPATTCWSSEGPVAALHGVYSYWCEICVVEEQLYFAYKLQASIPELEEKLKLLTEKETDGTN